MSSASASVPKCPGIRLIQRPMTYRRCQYNALPELGCCEKCIGWSIAPSDREAIRSKISELANATHPAEAACLNADYETLRNQIYFRTVHALAQRALNDAYTTGNEALLEALLKPVAAHIGDLATMEDVVDVQE